MKTTHVCEFCTTEFDAYASTRRRFCSKRCARLKDAEATRRTPRQRDCKGCGTAFEPTYPANVYCSLACANRTIGRTNREIMSAARRDSGEGKSYRKLLGRHEHRVVAEMMIGRPIRADEVVHHINGDFRDNRPENLRVMTRSEHTRMHSLEYHARRRNAA